VKSHFANLKLGPLIVSSIVTIGFFGIMVVVLFSPVTIDDKLARLLDVMFGNLSAAFGAVVQFHIGSSAGSKAKDDLHSDLLKALAPKAADAGGGNGA